MSDFRKRKDVLDFLRKQKGNIFLLQETHRPSNAENIVRPQWGCECVVAGHDSGSEGVAILLKKITLDIKYTTYSRIMKVSTF